MRITRNLDIIRTCPDYVQILSYNPEPLSQSRPDMPDDVARCGYCGKPAAFIKRSVASTALADFRVACSLQRLDARRLPVVHDEGAVVQLRDAGVELAQEIEHEGLVGLLLLLVEPAGLVVRVELVVGIAQLVNPLVALSAVGFLNLAGGPKEACKSAILLMAELFRKRKAQAVGLQSADYLL